MVLASAAIPTLFRAVHVDGGTYWDGLFSQNPPVRELLDTRPDELWVIQINPTARADEPTTVLDIADRRNELAGNLSLYQELHGSSRRSTSCWPRAGSSATGTSSHRPDPGVGPAAARRGCSGRRPSSTATPGSSAS